LTFQHTLEGDLKHDGADKKKPDENINLTYQNLKTKFTCKL